MHRALLALSAVLAASAVLAPGASAQAPAPITLTLKALDKGSTFAAVDLPPRAPRSHGFPTRFSPGDMLVFSNPLRDSANQPFGHLRVTCFTTVGGLKGARFSCLGVYGFPNGQVWATATTSPLSTVDTGVIIGGTGAYANMRGTFVSTHTKTGSDDTLTLIP
ncbi:MAG: hypothetical protein QOJ82_4157 [Solirubrobacteraceae bacterium]|jgi:hypothetical protein|nr:hypothetical protein [Solirubrobacteraceae bacterium]